MQKVFFQKTRQFSSAVDVYSGALTALLLLARTREPETKSVVETAKYYHRLPLVFAGRGLRYLVSFLNFFKYFNL